MLLVQEANTENKFRSHRSQDSSTACGVKINTGHVLQVYVRRIIITNRQTDFVVHARSTDAVNGYKRLMKCLNILSDSHIRIFLIFILYRRCRNTPSCVSLLLSHFHKETTCTYPVRVIRSRPRHQHRARAPNWRPGNESQGYRRQVQLVQGPRAGATGGEEESASRHLCE